MIKTKKGYHSISNGFVTWCFYEQAVSSMLNAFIDGDIDQVDKLSIFKFNNSTNEPVSSNWHGVINLFSLGEQLKRDRLRAERSRGID